MSHRVILHTLVGLMLGMILLGFVGSCASRDDFVTPAKRCAKRQLVGVTYLDKAARQRVASECAREIRYWAVKGLEAAQGHPADLNDARSMQEVKDRQRVALRVLVPLDGDPPIM